MVNFFPDNSVVRISNGIIENVNRDSRNTLLTVTYNERINNRRRNQTIVLVVNNNTTILDERGRPLPVRELSVGMTINAVTSSAMTRSIPPQSAAFLIRVISRPLPQDMTTIGRIVDIDRRNRSFTTIQNENPSSIIRFNVPEDAVILNRNGRPMEFSRLTPGMRVRVRHATFMTASIPPQTTAFEVRVI